MPFEIIRNDLTKMRVDAIVNTTGRALLGTGGVSKAIHLAAGPELEAACRVLGGCKVGEAKITPAFHLPSRYVIHTASPVWKDGYHDEALQLMACYRNAMELAIENGCESIAFPLIASGAHGYPVDQAVSIAISTIRSFLMKHDLSVFLVVFEKQAYHFSGKLFSQVKSYIDDAYAEKHRDYRFRQSDLPRSSGRFESAASFESSAAFEEMDFVPLAPCPMIGASAFSLEDELRDMDESFSQAVLRLIQDKGMKNSDCYKKANLDKKLFSKLVNDIHYKPKKTTAVAIAIALHLSFGETQELLMKAGLALSKSERFDIIITFCIKHDQYDVFQINSLLFDYDQPLLGSIIY